LIKELDGIQQISGQEFIGIGEHEKDPFVGAFSYREHHDF
jgi:hypothetical protein